MTAFLMTRGTPRRLDYGFLGAHPTDRWWEKLRDWTELETSEVIVRGGPDGPAVLVSGIPSARRDAVRTVIRFTVVLEKVEPRLLVGLAAAGLDPAARSALGAALDAEFSAAFVDATLAGAQLESDVVAGRVLRVLNEVIGPDEAPREPFGKLPVSWAAGGCDTGSVGGFLDRAGRLARGSKGWAFTTAALTTVDGARRAAEALGEPVAILLGEDGPPEVVDLGKARAGHSAGGGVKQWGHPVTMVGVVMVVLVLGLVALVVSMPQVSACSPPGAPRSSMSSSTSPGCAGPG